MVAIFPRKRHVAVEARGISRGRVIDGTQGGILASRAAVHSAAKGRVNPGPALVAARRNAYFADT